MKNINVLNVEVSYFKKCFDSAHPTTVNLLTFLRSEKHRAAVEQIRATEGKAERDDLKKTLLPGITPSGIFTHRTEKGLVKHSGLIAGDVDMKDNPYTPESLKAYISGFKNVAYCGLSASGRGIWFLIPIAYPQRHKEHFAALVDQFASDGINLDPAPANVASFRFYSYDAAAYFNPDAKPYTRLFSAPADTYTPAPRRIIAGNDAAKVEAILNLVAARRLDITGGYKNWVNFGLALASAFGEGGRDYFHQISQYHPTYCTRATDEQYTKCLRYTGNRVTIDYFFARAKAHGLTYREILPGAAPAAAAVAPALPAGWRRQRFTNADGAPVEILINEHGYPAAWDVTPETHEALSQSIKTNPLVSDLITRFDLQPGAPTHIT